MTESELRNLLLAAELPEEREAERRAWALLRAEFERRERVAWPRRRWRPLLAVGAAVALLAAAFTPPGRGLAERVQDAFDDEAPEAISLPAPGRLLVLSDEGPWIVQRDGSKRLLGAYEDAVWSPQGLFVAATRRRTLVALEPNGRVRWTLSRPAALSQPRWSPSGFRIAYKSGHALRVVAGDGTGDRLLWPGTGVAAPAWRPGSDHVLAFVDRRKRLRIAATDERRTVAARRRAGSTIRELVWSANGNLLLALTSGKVHHLYDAAAKPVATIEQPRGERALAAAFAPRGTALAYVAYEPAADASSVLVRERDGKTRTAFTGAGRVDGIAWSPDGRWLLVGWPAADQWLFLRTAGGQRVVTASALTAEFDPGGSGEGRFPRIVSWCC